MRKRRQQFDGAFKAKVALNAIKGEKSLSELASLYKVHPSQIRQWKQRVLDELPDLFSQRREKAEQDQQGLIDELYKQIGQLKVELDWLKKKSDPFG